MPQDTSISPASSEPRSMLHKTLAVVALVIAGAISVTWAWNTIVPDLTGLAAFRFAEGLSVAVAALLLGALFRTGGLLARAGLGGPRA